MGRNLKPLSTISPDSLEHNKARIDARLAAPKPTGKLKRPSKWLSEAEQKIWKRLVKSAPAHLGESDRALLEIAVTLKAKLETHTIENAQITQLISCLQKLGFIPGDRAAVEAPKAANPLDRFDA